jgi:hypothetical protein
LTVKDRKLVALKSESDPVYAEISINPLTSNFEIQTTDEKVLVNRTALEVRQKAELSHNSIVVA